MILFYIVLIVLADVLAARWILPIGFGLAVPAGVFAIAPIFTLRDAIHRKHGRNLVYALILVGTVISFFIGVLFNNFQLSKISFASAFAFAFSEYLDTFLYSAIGGSIQKKALISNIASSLLDSILFITIAFGFLPELIIGQYVVKLVISTIFIFVLLRR